MIVDRKKIIAICFLLSCLLVGVILVSLSVGAAKIGSAQVLRVLIDHITYSGGPAGPERLIILSVRLPRILLAGLVGAALAVAGCSFQALLRNPLADPYILGVSSGSALGAVSAILVGLSATSFGMPLASFCGAIVTVMLVFHVGKAGRGLHTNTLLLAGVIISAFFAAIIMFLISVAQNEDLSKIVFWLMGDFSSSDYRFVVIILPYILGGIGVLYSYARGFNLMVMGEETAIQLGIDVERLKKIAYIFASLVTAAAVSVCGLIGFVGLIIPHAVRMLFGPDHRLLIPASGLVGASFLICSDTIARTIAAPTELPVGAVTATFGAPFFIYLLKRRRV
ncbi:MAG: iron chelate uptake ABC transporter family permease subunit [Deltaproteobacteria bacterium]|nr:iron chelate uptake ABC transporter family permease subunit [Deltaproteobacteria bacterium]